MQVEVISKAAQRFNGKTYYLCGQYYQRKGERLHRTVWSYHNGTIPDGYHIHHIDSDRSNNQIENLAMIKDEEHSKYHANKQENKLRWHDVMQQGTEAAKEWHSTDDGKQWHSNHAKQYWRNAPLVTYKCDQCGAEYQTQNVSHKGNHFCSNKCRAAFRRDKGYDNEERTCANCGKQFITNKYTKAKCCCLECATNLRWHKTN